MDSYIKNMKQYLCEQYMYCKGGETDSLLEQLWYFRAKNLPFDSEAVTERLDSLEPIINTLSQKRQRRLMRTIIELCEEHERIAYMEGICTSFRLLHEIDMIEQGMDKKKERTDCHTSVRTGSQ